jgi:hypothetical protein
MRYAIVSFVLVFVSVGLVIAVALAFENHGDIAPFNRFAQSYNAYVAIDPRIQDLKALERMQKNWRALGKSQGWPEDKSCLGQ